MSLDIGRQYTTSRMRCVGIERRDKGGGGLSLRLKDDHGLVRTGFWIGETGMVRRALSLRDGDDLALAAGREVEVFFGVNGAPKSLRAVES